MDHALDTRQADLRSQDDRTGSHPCEHCERPARWIRNRAGSRDDSMLPIIARAVVSALHLDPERHAGMVAVFADRSGFTIARSTRASEVEGAWLYHCHWDGCDYARARRDRFARPRPTSDPAPSADAVHLYDAWRRARR